MDEKSDTTKTSSSAPKRVKLIRTVLTKKPNVGQLCHRSSTKVKLNTLSNQCDTKEKPNSQCTQGNIKAKDFEILVNKVYIKNEEQVSGVNSELNTEQISSNTNDKNECHTNRLSNVERASENMFAEKSKESCEQTKVEPSIDPAKSTISKRPKLKRPSFSNKNRTPDTDKSNSSTPKDSGSESPGNKDIEPCRKLVYIPTISSVYADLSQNEGTENEFRKSEALINKNDCMSSPQKENYTQSQIIDKLVSDFKNSESNDKDGPEINFDINDENNIIHGHEQIENTPIDNMCTEKINILSEVQNESVSFVLHIHPNEINDTNLSLSVSSNIESGCLMGASKYCALPEISDQCKNTNNDLNMTQHSEEVIKISNVTQDMDIDLVKNQNICSVDTSKTEILNEEVTKTETMLNEINKSELDNNSRILQAETLTEMDLIKTDCKKVIPEMVKESLDCVEILSEKIDETKKSTEVHETFNISMIGNKSGSNKELSITFQTDNTVGKYENKLIDEYKIDISEKENTDDNSVDNEIFSQEQGSESLLEKNKLCSENVKNTFQAIRKSDTVIIVKKSEITTEDIKSHIKSRGNKSKMHKAEVKPEQSLTYKNLDVNRVGFNETEKNNLLNQQSDILVSYNGSDNDSLLDVTDATKNDEQISLCALESGHNNDFAKIINDNDEIPVVNEIVTSSSVGIDSLDYDRDNKNLGTMTSDSCDSFTDLQNEHPKVNAISVIDAINSDIINNYDTDAVISHKYSMASINDDEDNLDSIEKNTDNSLTDEYITSMDECGNYEDHITCNESTNDVIHVDKVEQINNKISTEESIINEFFSVCSNNETCISESSTSDTCVDHFNRTSSCDNIFVEQFHSNYCENKTEIIPEENKIITTSNSQGMFISDHSDTLNTSDTEDEDINYSTNTNIDHQYLKMSECMKQSIKHDITKQDSFMLQKSPKKNNSSSKTIIKDLNYTIRIKKEVDSKLSNPDDEIYDGEDKVHHNISNPAGSIEAVESVNHSVKQFLNASNLELNAPEKSGKLDNFNIKQSVKVEGTLQKMNRLILISKKQSDDLNERSRCFLSNVTMNNNNYNVNNSDMDQSIKTDELNPKELCNIQSNISSYGTNAEDLNKIVNNESTVNNNLGDSFREVQQNVSKVNDYAEENYNNVQQKIEQVDEITMEDSGSLVNKNDNNIDMKLSSEQDDINCNTSELNQTISFTHIKQDSKPILNYVAQCNLNVLNSSDQKFNIEKEACVSVMPEFSQFQNNSVLHNETLLIADEKNISEENELKLSVQVSSDGDLKPVLDRVHTNINNEISINKKSCENLSMSSPDLTQDNCEPLDEITTSKVSNDNSVMNDDIVHIIDMVHDDHQTVIGTSQNSDTNTITNNIKTIECSSDVQHKTELISFVNTDKLNINILEKTPAFIHVEPDCSKTTPPPMKKRGRKKKVQQEVNEQQKNSFPIVSVPKPDEEKRPSLRSSSRIASRIMSSQVGMKNLTKNKTKLKDSTVYKSENKNKNNTFSNIEHMNLENTTDQGICEINSCDTLTSTKEKNSEALVICTNDENEHNKLEMIDNDEKKSVDYHNNEQFNIGHIKRIDYLTDQKLEKWNKENPKPSIIDVSFSCNNDESKSESFTFSKNAEVNVDNDESVDVKYESDNYFNSVNTENIESSYEQRLGKLQKGTADISISEVSVVVHNDKNKNRISPLLIKTELGLPADTESKNDHPVNEEHTNKTVGIVEQSETLPKEISKSSISEISVVFDNDEDKYILSENIELESHVVNNIESKNLECKNDNLVSEVLLTEQKLGKRKKIMPALIPVKQKRPDEYVAVDEIICVPVTTQSVSENAVYLHNKVDDDNKIIQQKDLECIESVIIDSTEMKNEIKCTISTRSSKMKDDCDIEKGDEIAMGNPLSEELMLSVNTPVDADTTSNLLDLNTSSAISCGNKIANLNYSEKNNDSEMIAKQCSIEESLLVSDTYDNALCNEEKQIEKLNNDNSEITSFNAVNKKKPEINLSVNDVELLKLQSEEEKPLIQQHDKEEQQNIFKPEDTELQQQYVCNTKTNNKGNIFSLEESINSESKDIISNEDCMKQDNISAVTSSNNKHNTLESIKSHTDTPESIDLKSKHTSEVINLSSTNKIQPIKLKVNKHTNVGYGNLIPVVSNKNDASSKMTLPTKKPHFLENLIVKNDEKPNVSCYVEQGSQTWTTPDLLRVERLLKESNITITPISQQQEQERFLHDRYIQALNKTSKCTTLPTATSSSHSSPTAVFPSKSGPQVQFTNSSMKWENAPPFQNLYSLPFCTKDSISSKFNANKSAPVSSVSSSSVTSPSSVNSPLLFKTQQPTPSHISTTTSVNFIDSKPSVDTVDPANNYSKESQIVPLSSPIKPVDVKSEIRKKIAYAEQRKQQIVNDNISVTTSTNSTSNFENNNTSTAATNSETFDFAATTATATVTTPTVATNLMAEQYFQNYSMNIYANIRGKLKPRGTGRRGRPPKALTMARNEANYLNSFLHFANQQYSSNYKMSAGHSFEENNFKMFGKDQGKIESSVERNNKTAVPLENIEDAPGHFMFPIPLFDIGEQSFGSPGGSEYGRYQEKDGGDISLRREDFEQEKAPIVKGKRGRKRKLIISETDSDQVDPVLEMAEITRLEEERVRKEMEREKKIEMRKQRLKERNELARLKRLRQKQKAEERQKMIKEKKMKLQEEKKKLEEEIRNLPPNLSTFDDETRMSADNGLSSQSVTNMSVIAADGGVEEDECSTATTESQKNKRAKLEVGDVDGKDMTVDQIAEYQWPIQGGDLYMIQEQISNYLGVKSFKRKYPDLKRRSVDSEERAYLVDSGLVSESLCELGLTAVASAEVLDIICSDFSEKYEELRKYMREKQVKELSFKQRAWANGLGYKLLMADGGKQDLKKRAMESASNWNSALNKSRKEDRRCVLDLQTFIVHYPQTKIPKPVDPDPKIGSYPVSILPGQYCDYYQIYTPDELRYLPLNTVLYGPIKQFNMPVIDKLKTKFVENESYSSSSSSSSCSSCSTCSSSSSDDDDDGGNISGIYNDANPDGSLNVDQEMDISQISNQEYTNNFDSKSSFQNDDSNKMTCKVCSSNEVNDGNDVEGKEIELEELIRCSQCHAVNHASCLELSPEMVPHVRKYNWLCTDCKVCMQCKDPADEDKMLFCDLCDRSYHIYCVGLRRVPHGRWHCSECAVCDMCGTKEPGISDNALWFYEYKKLPCGKNQYVKCLCLPCARKVQDMIGPPPQPIQPSYPKIAMTPVSNR